METIEALPGAHPKGELPIRKAGSRSPEAGRDKSGTPGTVEVSELDAWLRASVATGFCCPSGATFRRARIKSRRRKNSAGRLLQMHRCGGFGWPERGALARITEIEKRTTDRPLEHRKEIPEGAKERDAERRGSLNSAAGVVPAPPRFPPGATMTRCRGMAYPFDGVRYPGNLIWGFNAPQRQGSPAMQKRNASQQQGPRRGKALRSSPLEPRGPARQSIPRPPPIT